MSNPMSPREGAALQRRYDRLLALMQRRRPDWGVAYVGFQKKQTLMLEGGRWTICYRIHADLPDPGFRSSITVWPPRARGAKSGKRKTPERISRLERELRRSGYRGKWQEVAPMVRFGDYWKTLKDQKAIMVEIKRLEGPEWEGGS